MIIAVDTGGTKTLVVALSRDGTPLRQHKFPTPRDQATYLEAVRQSIVSLSEGQPLDGISLALPGVVRDQVAVICKNLDWHNFDIIGALRQQWPHTPMWLENDANLGGVGAANLINPRPHRLLYVTISTGVNGGLVIDGHIDQDTAEDELGDIIIDYDGQPTTWEQIAGGAAISAVYDQPIRDLTDQTVKDEISRRIARGLEIVIERYRPDIVAIGGGIGAHYALFAESVERELPDSHCPIIIAPNPEEIVAYGCYFHARNQLGI